MGWKFWKREQTEAERSLAALQDQARTRAAPAAASPPATAGPETDLSPEDAETLRRAEEHLTDVAARFEGLVPTGEEPGYEPFSFEVTATRPGDGGTIVLSGGAHTGQVAPGDTVAVMVVPDAMKDPDAFDDLESVRRQAELMLSLDPQAATVVSWRPESSELVVSGIAAVTTGATVSR
ncbi:hypothetical protein [Nocardioides sp.]|uniref:hypothetical protein n=1 Tax=Nocardioides sp. TaxID=35761 RepID=UPI002721EA62|nr:hypothetical protein [Nocardioides sp.]MDO9456758.1 hypothetical protein [Nocardioides sp.]